MLETRQHREVPLVGYARPGICDNRLPTNRPVLECYFYHTRYSTPKLNAREALQCAVRKCAIFWEYVAIPMIKECHAITKLEKLVKSYKTILKYGTLRDTNVNYKVKEIDFKCSLNELFDIAHQTQVSVMKNAAAMTLLNLQREKGRSGCLDIIIDTETWTVSDIQEAEDEEETESLQQALPVEIAMDPNNYVFNEDEEIEEILRHMTVSTNNSEGSVSDYEVELLSKKPRLKIITGDITAILDRAKVSDRMAARVLAAILIRAGVTLEDVHLSRETIRRNRRMQRESLSNTIRDNAKTRLSRIRCIHWDSKQMSAPENKFKKIDRLPVLGSGYEWHQLLGVPRIERGTGEAQAKAVYQCLKKWNMLDNVCAMVFDTTASNTGNVNGACIWLEELLERDLLYLACRHHVFELLLKAASESAMGCTSGPDVLIFK